MGKIREEDFSEAIISLKTLQNCDEEKPDLLDFMTDGQYLFSKNTGHIKYAESELTGMEGTQTSLTILPDRIVVDRRGSITSRMEFVEGEKNSFLYATPFGNATMSLDTRKISHSFSEEGGRAEIEYVMDLDHKVFSRNRFIINVERTEGRTDA